jgi:intraflagellar transport protein 140
MISAAEYYESQGMIDKAVMLYHKGGRVGKALEMCFDHSLFQVLANVAEDLDETTDPELLQRAADFFMENGLNDKAVNLLITARRFDEAVDLIQKHRIVVTEEQVERMTYAKGEVDKKVRNTLLEKVADICNKQGARGWRVEMSTAPCVIINPRVVLL